MPSGQQQPRCKPTMVHRICGLRSQNAMFSKGSWGHTSLANRSAKYQAWLWLYSCFGGPTSVSGGEILLPPLDGLQQTLPSRAEVPGHGRLHVSS